MRRREFLRLGLGTVALSLVGCKDDESGSDLAAWAGPVGDSRRFRQTLAWVEPNEVSGRTVAVAFTPFDVDSDQRRAVVANKGVYPVFRDADILEVRLVMAPPDEGQSFGIKTLRELRLTFWNWADPTPVVVLNKGDWTSSPDLQIEGLDGNFVPGGWIDGTIRGRAIVEGGPSRAVYVWNLSMATSID